MAQLGCGACRLQPAVYGLCSVACQDALELVQGSFPTGPGRRRKSPGRERSGSGITGRARSRRSRVTVAVSVLFAAVALTGYVLLAVSGAGSGIGLWHYRIGIAAAVLFCGHILKRASVLRKSLSGSGRQASGKVRRAGWRVRRTMSVH